MFITTYRKSTQLKTNKQGYTECLFFDLNSLPHSKNQIKFRKAEQPVMQPPRILPAN